MSVSGVSFLLRVNQQDYDHDGVGFCKANVEMHTNDRFVHNFLFVFMAHTPQARPLLFGQRTTAKHGNKLGGQKECIVYDSRRTKITIC
jgi:hypothetical protein